MSDLPTRSMTAEEFEALAKKIVHHGPGWQSRIAAHLSIHRSSVSRWVAGFFYVPEHIAERMRRDADG